MRLKNKKTAVLSLSIILLVATLLLSVFTVFATEQTALLDDNSNTSDVESVTVDGTETEKDTDTAPAYTVDSGQEELEPSAPPENHAEPSPAITTLSGAVSGAKDSTISTVQELRNAVAAAKPKDTIVIKNSIDLQDDGGAPLVIDKDLKLHAENEISLKNSSGNTVIQFNGLGYSSESYGTALDFKNIILTGTEAGGHGLDVTIKNNPIGGKPSDSDVSHFHACVDGVKLSGFTDSAVVVETDEASPLRLENASVTGSSAVKGGGILVNKGGLLLSNSIVEDNRAAVGAGICVANGSFLNLFQGSNQNSIKNNAAIKLDDSTIPCGGGVAVEENGVLLLDAADIVGNTAIDGNGGGVYYGRHTYSHKFSSTASVDGNSAKNGGGLYFESNEIINEKHSVQLPSGAKIINNQASEYGGGIYLGKLNAFGDNPGAGDCDFDMMGSSVSGNTAGNGGGGIMIAEDNLIRLSGGHFNNNTANGTQGGGAILSYTHKPFVSSMNYSGNAAPQGNGGAIHIESGNLLIRAGKFTQNSAINGGAIYTPYDNLSNLTTDEWPPEVIEENGDAIQFADNSASIGYKMNDADDILMHSNHIFTKTFTEPFIYGYNNYDIAYPKGGPLSPVTEHTVTFSLEPEAHGGFEGGTSPVELQVADGALWDDAVASSVPVPVAEIGYYFAGWAPQLPETNISIEENLSFVAQFKPQTAITISAGSSSKVYDGTPLRNNTFTLSSGSLKEGDSVKVTMTASSHITNVSNVKNNNIISTVQLLRGGSGETVNHEYKINLLPGTLSITPKPATITVHSSSKNAGQPDPAFRGTVSGLVRAGDLGTISYYRTAGEAAGRYTIAARYSNPNTNYRINIVPGSFTIHSLPVDPTPPVTPPVDPEPEEIPTPIAPVEPDEEPPEPEEPTIDPADEDDATGGPIASGVDNTLMATSDVSEFAAKNSPIFSIGDTEVPLFGQSGKVWALVNLILAILAAVIALLSLVTMFRRKNTDTDDYDYQDNRNNKTLWRLFGIITAVVAIITFFITQDMSLPMAFMDKWTILMALLLIAQLTFTILTRRTRIDDDLDDHEVYQVK